MPYLAARPTPTVNAVGMARPKEQGQATTTTEMKILKLYRKGLPKTTYHTTNEIKAIINIAGIKYFITLSANF